ncbi:MULTISPECIES: RNA-binding S4 domain-containing protein [Shewanella]|uniref:RNA-binding S4 domain protein n=5 Tax=Shewanella TaxID=22 RepID=A9KWM2_SHEB9|nr:MULTISPECIES: RNA-binding S4 domain-containing protein [Shewanella]EGT3625581.1 RNA-binding S4 domain-containing protein [Morganella morganii]MBU1392697.1 RNA-binding S4 domain-containing protein [Gammaproteobacteria bacterium]MCI2963484.1 RNA-binding S4 domain-containing protein [Shewanella sp. N2AIL]MCT7945829.1 RNA-binding S4 domain-containing protein [Shewanella septentrionalis]QYX66304.1 RNA-binding S4 domain-containing protein [Shewanella putrefaciens]
MAQINQLALHSGEDFIELYKVLKVQGMSNAGGEAKHFIEEGQVTVNGEVETRKRKKIIAGDIVSFNGESVQIIAAE